MSPIVLIHGWGAAPPIWQPLIACLTGRTIINLALPGYGNSGSWREPEAWLAAQLPPRCHLVGWSLGGNLAVSVAAKWPERVESLVTIASVPVFVADDLWPWAMPKQLFDLFLNSVQQDPVSTLKRFAALEAKGASSERLVLKSLRSASLEHDRAALIESLQWLEDCDQRVIWQQLVLPRRHIFCEGDALVPVEAAEHTDCSQVLAAAGHAPMQSMPVQLASCLEQFWRDKV